MTADPAGWPDPARPGRDAMADAVRLDECPPGLFMFDGTLCFRSEYTTTLDNPRRYQPDAYVVETGEYFWGGAKTTEERSALMVVPVSGLTPADLAAERAAAAEAMREAAADCARLLLLPDDCGPAEAHGRFQQAIATCEAIRAIPLPDASALAERDERMREDGRREEREACAALLESMRAAHNTAMIGVWHTPDTTIAYGKAAAAIRARSKGKS